MAGCECCDNFSMIDGGDEFKAFPGLKGDDGTTFYPHVSAEGVLSWTNDGGKPNPDPVNIKGTDGKSAYQAAVEAGFSGTEAEFNTYLSGIGNLTDLVDRKAGALVDTASGAIASFVPDSTIDNLLGVSVAVEPVQDLHGYDSPWPAGGGKNKLRNAGATATINGVTFTVASDGTVTANGTASSNATFTVTPTRINLPDGDYILSGCPSGGTGSTYFMAVNSLVGINDYGSGKEFSVTASDSINVIIRVVSGATVSNLVFKPMIRLSTVTDPTFAPYENICPISGWDAVGIEAAGVNLCDISNTMIGRAWNYATASNRAALFLRLKYGVQYTLSKSGNGSLDGVYYGYKNEITDNATWNGGSISAMSSNSVPVLMPSQTAKYLVVGFNKSNITQADVEAVNLQLERGTTATAFKPYSGTTYTINLGQTVYGGTLDVDAGTMTVDRAMIDCASITTWTIDTSAKRIYKIMSELVPASGGGVVADGLICNRFKSISANQIYANVEGVAISTGSALQFRINGLTDNPDVTLADVNSYFTANETKVVAKLVTPIVIDLDPVTIATIANQTNNVWADVGDVSVTFAADIKAYIDRLNQPTEDDMIANTLIAANKYFTVNNRLFLSTASIAAGAQIIPGTNCTETSLAAALNALNA